MSGDAPDRHRETIPDALDGERVDRVVSMLTGASRSRAQELLAAGLVHVDGVVVTKPSTRVVVGSTVLVDAYDEPSPVPVPDDAVDVRVVYEDDDVLVIDKPAGLVVHPGAGTSHGTLVSGLLARHPELASVGEPHRPGIVHRLDKGTSGLMMVARTEQAYHSLVEQLATHEVSRRYVALACGHVTDDAGVVDAPVGRSKRDPTRMAVTPDGRDARTHYDVQRRFTHPFDATLLECRLETGRTHQIRVHLSAIGHPVLGDDRYGGRRTQLRMDRPFLHAAALSFRHPRDGEWRSYEVALPADLVEVLNRFS